MSWWKAHGAGNLVPFCSFATAFRSSSMCSRNRPWAARIRDLRQLEATLIFTHRFHAASLTQHDSHRFFLGHEAFDLLNGKVDRKQICDCLGKGQIWAPGPRREQLACRAAPSAPCILEKVNRNQRFFLLQPFCLTRIQRHLRTLSKQMLSNDDYIY